MLISILTLFPEIFSPIFSSSIIGRAQKKKLVKINIVNIRDFAFDRHHTVDDKPYGGGIGMVMKVDVVAKAIESSKIKNPPLPAGRQKSKFREVIILLDPKGKEFNQEKARRLAKFDHLILICGHYEGIDDRISHFIDEKISIGSYVLTGGEIPAMVITDTVIRLIPGVLANSKATVYESFGKDKYLEEPQYTKPRIFRNLSVPKILLSGNHANIQKWRVEKRKLLK